MTDFERERRDEYRNEAKQDEMEDHLCPCCGSQLKVDKPYYEDGYLAESGVECKSCGYASGTSYGSRYLELPDGWKLNENGEITKILEDKE